ncbi:MAG: hypothetical protein ACLPX9_01665 [Rhodomicrobium sp.]
MSWVLWLIGIAIAVVVGLSIFGVYDVPYVIEHIKAYSDGPAKALFVALGLVALSKVLG